MPEENPAYVPKAEVLTYEEILRFAGVAVSLGEVDTLVYPMPKRGGIFRISVGIESFDDIAAEFDQALEHVR